MATKDRIENCAECLHQAWTLEDSYVISNGRAHAEESGAAHAEAWWYSNNTIVANHDTLLNPSKQTAVIFGESGGGKCVNHETVINSLIAGGGYMLYFCQNTSGERRQQHRNQEQPFRPTGLHQKGNLQLGRTRGPRMLRRKEAATSPPAKGQGATSPAEASSAS